MALGVVLIGEGGEQIGRLIMTQEQGAVFAEALYAALVIIEAVNMPADQVH